MHIVLVVKIAELEDGGMSLLEGREKESQLKPRRYVWSETGGVICDATIQNTRSTGILKLWVASAETR